MLRTSTSEKEDFTYSPFESTPNWPFPAHAAVSVNLSSPGFQQKVTLRPIPVVRGSQVILEAFCKFRTDYNIQVKKVIKNIRKVVSCCCFYKT